MIQLCVSFCLCHNGGSQDHKGTAVVVLIRMHVNPTYISCQVNAVICCSPSATVCISLYVMGTVVGLVS